MPRGNPAKASALSRRQTLQARLVASKTRVHVNKPAGRRQMLRLLRRQLGQAPGPKPAGRRAKAQAAQPPAGAVAHPAPGRPANNTTCDIYFSPNVPPAAPDVAGVACCLVPVFRQGGEASEGDLDLRFTHVLYCAATVDVRDNYPGSPSHSLYVPTSADTGYEVVFVELVNRGQPDAYKRVYLDRNAVTWPSNEL
jgi:hypothetical protein